MLGLIKNRAKPYHFLAVIFLAVFLLSGCSSQTPQTTADQPKVEEATQPVVQSQEQAEGPVVETEEDIKTENVEQTGNEGTSIPKYEIIYELKDKRYDGGISYFVLIDPVNLSSDNFKNDIKNIVNKIVKEKGPKISVDFVDNKTVLEFEYKSHYGSNTLGRILSKDEMNQLGLHLVATFSGELKTDIYPNTLLFFPATFTDNPKVGEYVESIEFNPDK